MSLEVLCASVLIGALIAYAIFGGADFGAGFWTAFAFGSRRREQQEAMFNAMGPVWETNHVWLILVLVTLWTTFPTVFAAIFTSLYVPLTVALLGIVFRGAAFAFQHYGREGSGELPATALVFSAASIITPFAMGLCIGAVASGNISVDAPTSDAFDAWLHPFPIVCGFIALAITAFLTPFYMLVRPVGELLESFRRTGFVGALALGSVTTLALPVAAWNAEEFAGDIVRPLPFTLMLAAVSGGVVSLLVLWKRLYSLAPFIAGATVSLVIAAWAAAQYPHIVMPDIRIDDVAASHATLRAFLISLAIGMLILVPSLLWLFTLFGLTPATDEPEGYVESSYADRGLPSKPADER